MPESDDISSFNPELLAQIQQLQTQHWTKTKKAADAVGLVKPENQDWDNFAETIAIAQFEKEGKNILLESPGATQPANVIEIDAIVEPSVLEPVSEQEVITVQSAVTEAAMKPVFPTQHYRDTGIAFCEQCGERYRYDQNFVQFCPIALENCPTIATT